MWSYLEGGQPRAQVVGDREAAGGGPVPRRIADRVYELVADPRALAYAGHEPLAEQRLTVGGGNAPAPARRPGRRTRLERGLDGGGGEPRGLRVDDDVPAEQNAADDPPGMRGRVMRADGGGARSHPDCRRNGPGPAVGHAGFATPFTTIAGRRPPGPGLRR
jgi:hypothetical protein